MKKQANIFISEVNFIRSGTTNGRNWSMYAVVDQNAVKYTTFNDKYLNLIGQKVDIEYEEAQVPGKKEGQVFTNRTIIDKPASKKVVERFRAGARMKGESEDREFDRKFDEENDRKALGAEPREVRFDFSKVPAAKNIEQKQLDRIEEMVKEIHGQMFPPNPLI